MYGEPIEVVDIRCDSVGHYEQLKQTRTAGIVKTTVVVVIAGMATAPVLFVLTWLGITLFAPFAQPSPTGVQIAMMVLMGIVLLIFFLVAARVFLFFLFGAIDWARGRRRVILFN